MTNTALRDQLMLDLDAAIAETVTLRRWLETIKARQDEIIDFELQYMVRIMDVYACAEKMLSALGGCPTIIKWVEAKREVQP